MQKGFILMLILFIIIGVFAISNSSVVAIDFIFTEVLLSQAIVIFICVLLGFLMASIFGLIRQMGFRKQIKELGKENEALKEEVDRLKVQEYKHIEERLKEKEKEKLKEELKEKEKEKEKEKSKEEEIKMELK